jgi:hypothetical protein
LHHAIGRLGEIRQNFTDNAGVLEYVDSAIGPATQLLSQRGLINGALLREFNTCIGAMELVSDGPTRLLLRDIEEGFSDAGVFL